MNKIIFKIISIIIFLTICLFATNNAYSITLENESLPIKQNPEISLNANDSNSIENNQFSYNQPDTAYEKKDFKKKILKLKTTQEKYEIKNAEMATSVRGVDEINKNDFKYKESFQNTNSLNANLGSQNVKSETSQSNIETTKQKTSIQNINLRPEILKKIKSQKSEADKSGIKIIQSNYKVTEPVSVAGVRGADELKLNVNDTIYNLLVCLDYVDFSQEELIQFKKDGRLSEYKKYEKKKNFFTKHFGSSNNDIKDGEKSAQIIKNALSSQRKYLDLNNLQRYPVKFNDPEFSNSEIHSARIYYLNAILRGLADETKKSEYKFKCDIFYEDNPNAFTLPSGYMFISEKLLNILDNEDELAAVLAHELAHITLNHHSGFSSFGKEIFKNVVNAVAEEQKESAEKAIKTVNNTFVSNSFSRGDEHAADKKAVEYLLQHGYNPFALISVIEKFKELSRISDTLIAAFLNSHPQPETRINRIKEQLKDYKEADFQNENFNIRKNRFNDIIKLNSEIKNIQIADNIQKKTPTQALTAKTKTQAKLLKYEYNESGKDLTQITDKIINLEIADGYYPVGINIRDNTFFVMYLQDNHIFQNYEDAKIVFTFQSEEAEREKYEAQGYLPLSIAFSKVDNKLGIYTLYVKCADLPFTAEGCDLIFYGAKDNFKNEVKDKISKSHIPVDLSVLGEEIGIIYFKSEKKIIREFLVEIVRDYAEAQTIINKGLELNAMPVSFTSLKDKALIMFIR